LPAIDHALHDVNIALAGKGSQRHGIAENINEMNSVKSFFALEVAGANQVHLVGHIWRGGLQVGIGSGTRAVNRFNQKSFSFEDTVDGPDRRHRADPQLLKLPLNRHGPFLGVFSFDQPLADRTDQLNNSLGSFFRGSLGSSGLTSSPMRIAGIINFEPLV